MLVPTWFQPEQPWRICYCWIRSVSTSQLPSHLSFWFPAPVAQCMVHRLSQMTTSPICHFHRTTKSGPADHCDLGHKTCQLPWLVKFSIPFSMYFSYILHAITLWLWEFKGNKSKFHFFWHVEAIRNPSSLLPVTCGSNDRSSRSTEGSSNA